MRPSRSIAIPPSFCATALVVCAVGCGHDWDGLEGATAPASAGGQSAAGGNGSGGGGATGGGASAGGGAAGPGGSSSSANGGGRACGAELADCNGSASDGCETWLEGDPNHCGACGTKCDPGELCTGGQCECLPDYEPDGAGCVDVDSDPSDCGGDGRPACAGATPYCYDGNCVASCPADTTSCGGGCVDLSEHPLHCGACNDPCGADQLCDEGRCTGYEPAVGCSSCPCPACEAPFECCNYPESMVPICSDECGG